MKKIILFISLIFISFNSYSQKDPKQMDREIAKHLFDKGFERDQIRSTIVLVREMSKEMLEKKKLSKKTKKKIKENSFSDEQVQVLESLSKKMSKIIASTQKKKETRDDKSDNLNQRQNSNSRASGRNFSGGQRQGSPRGGQRFGPPNNRRGPAGAQTQNPVFVKLMEYVREQGVGRENIRDVMGSVQTIGKEYRSAADKSNFKPSDKAVESLSNAGLSNESILIIVEIIKAL